MAEKRFKMKGKDQRIEELENKIASYHDAYEGKKQKVYKLDRALARCRDKALKQAAEVARKIETEYQEGTYSLGIAEAIEEMRVNPEGDA